MSSVQIRDVRKSFGCFEALHGASTPIEDGEFVEPAADTLALSRRQNLDGVSGCR